MDESRIIIDWNEQGDGSYGIRVVGYRNFKQHFSEAFYSIERPMSVFSVSDSSISGEVACNSATITLLKHLLNIIGNGKTTWAKALQLLASGLNLKDPINNLYYVFLLWNAKDLAMRIKRNYNDWSIIIARCEFRDELREHRFELLKDLVRFFKEYMLHYGYKHLCTEDDDYKYYQTLNLPCIKRGFMGYHYNYGAPLKDIDV